MFGAEFILSQVLSLTEPHSPVLNREIVLSRNSSIQQRLPQDFYLLVWNIQKGQTQNEWKRDFRQLNRNTHLALLQEAMIDGFVDAQLRHQPHQNWSMSASFETKQGITGVATGVSSKIQSFNTLVSPVTEPIANTPKVTQVKMIQLESGENLLTLNTHAINFATQNAFEKHIESILPALKNHQGPILWAGDFNTWNKSRLIFLDRTLQTYNLNRVTLKQDPRRLKLDHIYLRGCQAAWVKVEDQVNTSDHYPLRANILCPESKI